MKNILFVLSFVFVTACTQAQTTVASKPAQNIDHIPPFHILTKDSTILTSANLKKGKPVMIIYFAPDCSHCQRLMYEMQPEMDKFKDMQIVMVTFTQTSLLKMLREFYKDYSFSKYPNIMMGSEYPNYIVQRYYNVTNTPFIAVYDHKGKLVQSFVKPPAMKDLEAAVKKS